MYYQDRLDYAGVNKLTLKSQWLSTTKAYALLLVYVYPKFMSRLCSPSLLRDQPDGADGDLPARSFCGTPTLLNP